MQNDSTKELDKLLEGMLLSDYETYQNQRKESMVSLPEYFNSYLLTHHLDKKTLIKRSQLNRTYGYQILSGDRRFPSRNKILSLCFGAQMTLKETQKALTLSHNAILYARDPRDSAIILCLHNKIYNLAQVNLFLYDHKFDPIT